MMESFFIRNFKNIRRLELQGLKQLNLFTGKNNTGKSTLLEAIALYVNEGHLSIIAQLLIERGEISDYRTGRYRNPMRKKDTELLASLFTDRKVGYDFAKDSILFSQLRPSLFTSIEHTQEELRIGFVRFIDEKITSQDETIYKRRFLTENAETNQPEEAIELGLQIKVNGRAHIVPLGDNELYRKLSRQYGADFRLKTSSFQFIQSGLSKTEESSYLWDQITLTEKENFVIEALQIIEPDIQRIAFVGETPDSRTAVVKLKGKEQVVPLKGMGDGINRVLHIILSAVNSDNGYLLIDEFENGLHHSVQEQLWSILIRLSQALNIQVFTTTHSNDCIDGFENAIGKSKNTSSGRLFRLEKTDKQDLQVVAFDIEEVKIATDENIEIR